MQQNKYLDKLRIPIEEYGVNFTDQNDKRKEKWKKQRKKYGFDERETWSLDQTFVEWIYSHLMMYLEIGGKIINLEYHKFEFKDREYTQREAIEYICKACENFLLDKSFDYEKERQITEDMKDAIRLFAEIFPAMWW